MKREIITIDEELCDGCGLCVPACPEGALQIVDGKAKLVSDIYCDGLGACIGNCPQGAITVETREAGQYDERKVMENLVRHGEETTAEHLQHLEEHGQMNHFKEAIQYLIDRELDIPEEFKSLHGGGGEALEHTGTAHSPQLDAVLPERSEAGCSSCPGSRVVDLREREHHHGAVADAAVAAGEVDKAETANTANRLSALRQWPVQIKLVPPFAPYLKNADLLIAADCVPFAYADFHDRLLKDKILLVGCPKLDDAAYYTEKLSQIFSENDIQSITLAHMEVPCCFGLSKIVESALKASGKNVPIEDVNVSIRGEVL